MVDKNGLLKKAGVVLDKKSSRLPAAAIRRLVESILSRREQFLALGREHGSPLYVLDEKALRRKAKEFRQVFEKEIPGFQPFYAVKCNNCPELARIVATEGYGLDVSSGVELQMALENSSVPIIFSGPGKLPEEHRMALANSERVTILLDSFGELERLGHLAAGENKNIRVGVRLTTQEKGLWRKFGIPLADLESFFDKADKIRSLNLCGLQFHTSWNMDPSAQVSFLKRLGKILKKLPRRHLERIEFLDLGGGFWPPQGEWLQASATEAGRLRAALDAAPGLPQGHFLNRAVPLEDFAGQLRAVLEKDIFPHCRCKIFAEPGRWVAHEAMHILLQVVDKKAMDMVITDGGINIVGWERYESDYFPVVNLSRPGLKENKCWLFGSLCTPHDIWGYAYHGQGIEPGDYLLVPYQGAYTFSLRQNFIKPLPPVVVWQDNSSEEHHAPQGGAQR